MIDPLKIYLTLKNNDIESFYGVPDSVLKHFTKLLENKEKNHFITSNEGLAVAGAIGSFLSSKKISLVYMQNSGLGNAINPLASIAHKGVYGIPILLMIGWRGYNGKDEPQHNIKGKITTKILNLLNIKYEIIENNKDLKLISKLLKISRNKNCPVAIIIKTNSLIKQVEKKLTYNNNNNLSREEVINFILDNSPKHSKIISTTGYTSREINELIKYKKNIKQNFFYMIGGMGHSSMVSFGVSMNTSKKVICLDGDGALIMHMGSLITTGFKSKKNFKHILLNNFCHESVGMQKIDTKLVNFKTLTQSCGYKNYYKINNLNQLKNKFQSFIEEDGPSFLEILITTQSMKNLGRPKNFKDVKKHFMKN